MVFNSKNFFSVAPEVAFFNSIPEKLNYFYFACQENTTDNHSVLLSYNDLKIDTIMKTNKMKRALIALDYDHTSQKVAEVGFSMAQAMHAETILLHVVSEQPLYYSSYMNMQELQIDILDDLKKSTQNFLDKTKKHLGNESIQTVLKEGDIAETILETAKKMDVDIIVMGSHSRKWLENIILGSEAEDVLKKTTIPLFIVPTKKRD